MTNDNEQPPVHYSQASVEEQNDVLIAYAIRWWQSFEAPDRSDMEELFELLVLRDMKGLQELVSNLDAEED